MLYQYEMIKREQTGTTHTSKTTVKQKMDGLYLTSKVLENIDKGITKTPYNTFRVRIYSKGRTINVGCYPTKKEATKAKLAALVKHGLLKV